MTPDRYMRLCARTAAEPHDDLKARFKSLQAVLALHLVMYQMIFHGQQLDEIKRFFFYGKPLSERLLRHYDLMPDGLENLPPPKAGILEALQDPKIINLLHSSIGMATEASELLEQMFGTIFNAIPLDEINMAEELGDSAWYQSLGLATLQTNYVKVWEANIAKLRARYPDKFTETDANVRDLPKERGELEKKL